MAKTIWCIFFCFVFALSLQAQNYRINPPVDVISATLIIAGSANLVYGKQQPYTGHFPQNPQSTFFPDKNSIGIYRPQWSEVTPFLQGTLLLGGGALLLANTYMDSPKDAFSVAALYVQSIGLTYVLTENIKQEVSRYRPHVYSPDFPVSERNTERARASFWSGQTAISFTTAGFIHDWSQHYIQNENWRKVAVISAYSLAGAVGTSRVIAGEHYVTDVLTGALVGWSIGYFTHKLHRVDRKNKQSSLQISPFYVGFQQRF